MVKLYIPSTRTLVELPPDLAAEIDKLVGPRKRSTFVAELVEREVKRLRLMKLLSDDKPWWKDEDHPEWPEGDSDAWVRKLREESETRHRRRMGLVDKT